MFLLLPCGTKLFAEVYFWGLAIDVIICILQELFFAFRTDWFFLLGTDFFAKERKKVSDKSLIIFSSVFIEYVQWKHIFKEKHYVLRTLC